MSGLTGCPYEILGVSEMANEEQITDNEFEAKLASCNQAYALLNNAEQTRAFDRKIANEKEKVKMLIYIHLKNLYNIIEHLEISAEERE